jgi:hypothetical protein
LKFLTVSVALSWVGCVGWFLCFRTIDRFSDWGVFYSPVFWFPILLIIYFTRQKIKNQFSNMQPGIPRTV